MKLLIQTTAIRALTAGAASNGHRPYGHRGRIRTLELLDDNGEVAGFERDLVTSSRAQN